MIGERATPERVENSGRPIEALWDRHGFYANNQSLKAVLNRLEQRYGQKIVMRSDRAQSRMMTLYYPQAVELEVILNDISTAGELRYRPISGGYELVDNAAE